MSIIRRVLIRLHPLRKPRIIEVRLLAAPQVHEVRPLC